MYFKFFFQNSDSSIESGATTFESSSFHSSEERELLMAEFDDIMQQSSAGRNDVSFDGGQNKHVQMDDEQLASLYNEFLELKNFLV